MHAASTAAETAHALTDPAEVAEASQRIEALQQRLEAATKTRKEAICRLEGLALAMAPWHATLS